MGIKNVFNKKKINLADYANIHTGETLSSECPNITSLNIKNENFGMIHSAEYIIIDSKAFRYLQSICTKSDLEKIQRLSDMVKGLYNILHDDDGKPHNRQTLRICLDYDASEFSRFMKRLHTKSIIYFIDGYKDNRKCKWIMLNPTFARKSKMFHKDCISVFENLSK